MFNSKEMLFKWAIFLCLTAVVMTVAVTFPDVPFLSKITTGKGFGSADSEKPDEHFLEWFNRDPERKIPSEQGLIVSPADGYVLGIKEVNGAKHLIIEMRYFDVHVQRMPIAGKVVEIKGGGRVLDDEADLGQYWSEKMLPFQKFTALDTEIGRVAVRQITSLFAKRIEVFVTEGQEVAIGQRLGRVLAGSTVVLEMPPLVELMVDLDDNVFAGETVVARYKEANKND